jgi:hypothetical protein
LHIENLNKRLPSFKDEFMGILNWPLIPTEFEAAWQQLLHKYKLYDDHMMLHMWEDRKEWISAYLKEAFCARMTSTQRSKSMNYILKKGYISQEQNLHRFIEQVNNCVFTRSQLENQQTLASMVSQNLFSAKLYCFTFTELQLMLL